MIPGLPNPWVILGLVLFFFASIGTAYVKGGHDKTIAVTAAYESSLAKQRDEANTLLLKSKDTARAREIALQEHNDEIEGKYADLMRYTNGLRLANGRLIDATCGLYDKNGRPRGEGGGDGMPGDTAAAYSAQGRPAACDIPNEVLRAVREFGRGVADLLLEADSAAIYAQAGHDYAIGPSP